MRERVPENHLSQFILDAVDEMDTGGAKVNHRGSGSEQYPPAMLLSLLIYSYSSGVFSSRSIERVSQAANDKQELVDNVRAIDPVIQSVGSVLIDSGFVSEAAVKEVEEAGEDGRGAPEVLAVIKRERHHRSVADLEKKDDPPPPGEDASFSEKMAHRVATKEGRARYKQRQQTIEPVFGIIKEAIGFRRFSLRGQGKVALEWTLVCVAYNLRRLHRLTTIKTQNITPAWA